MTKSSEPLFDSPKAALTFALNYHLGPTRPQMNKMMADGKVKKIDLANGSQVEVEVPVVKRGPQRSNQLKGVDGVAQAGMILQVLARLPEPQQLTLIAYALIPTTVCSCRSACCQGYRANQEWVRTVLKLCDYLRDEAELSKIKGKKGLSTQPLLRRLLVEKFFIPEKNSTLVELAMISGITEQTVIAHRRPILVFLEKQMDDGWRAFDEDLGKAGIVGFIG